MNRLGGEQRIVHLGSIPTHPGRGWIMSHPPFTEKNNIFYKEVMGRGKGGEVAMGVEKKKTHNITLKRIKNEKKL